MQPTNAKEEFVKEGAEKMTERDVEKVIVKSEDIQQKFSPRGPLHRFVEDAKLPIAMIGRRAGVLGGIVLASALAAGPVCGADAGCGSERSSDIV